MPGKRVRVQDRGSPAGQDGQHTLHNPSEQTKNNILTAQYEINKNIKHKKDKTTKQNRTAEHPVEQLQYLQNCI